MDGNRLSQRRTAAEIRTKTKQSERCWSGISCVMKFHTISFF